MYYGRGQSLGPGTTDDSGLVTEGTATGRGDDAQSGQGRRGTRVDAEEVDR